MNEEKPQNIDTSATPPIEPQQVTAQIPQSEPLPSESVLESKPVEPEPLPKSESVEANPSTPSPTQAEPVLPPTSNLARDLLNRARFAIQLQKRKKLDRIMTLFSKRTNITNDEVEKFLHVSDATSTRYLEILEKEGKIRQSGKTGKGVMYTKI